MAAIKGRRRTKIKKRWRREGWQRYRVLYICIVASVLIHLSIIFSISPWWLRRAPKVKPRKVKAVSLKIKPRPIAARPPVKVAPRPAVTKPVEKVPAPKPVYTKREIEQKLTAVRSEAVPKKFAQPKATRAKEVIKKKESEMKAWVDKEAKDIEERVEREAAGSVGYSRVIDLQKSSDYQIGRLMDHFKMGMGSGSRKVTDLNVQFTSEWLFTPGQIRNYLSRYASADYRKIIAELPAGASTIVFRESGDGSSRPYIAPTVAAMASLLMAEEEYFAETSVDPKELEKLIFGPIWSYQGPVFKVVRAERKKPIEEQKSTADKTVTAE